MVLFHNNVFRLIYVVFGRKSENLERWKKRESMMKKDCSFEEKNLFIFLKAFFIEIERRKICGW